MTNTTEKTTHSRATQENYTGVETRPVSQKQIDAFKAAMMAFTITDPSQISQVMTNVRNMRMPNGRPIMEPDGQMRGDRAKRKEREPFFVAAQECFRTKAQAAVHTIAKPRPGQITNEAEVKKMAEMAKALFGASRMPNVGEETRMERQASFDQVLENAQNKAMKRINAAQSIHRMGQHNMQERLTA
jgi:hypothetical protein